MDGVAIRTLKVVEEMMLELRDVVRLSSSAPFTVCIGKRATGWR